MSKQIVRHIIDCDADPYTLDDWKVEEHQKSGQFQWDPNKVELYLCDEQKSGSIEGNKLYNLLKGKKVLNACVLDYLLDNSQLIPEEWNGKMIFFWGTIYRDWFGQQSVRYFSCVGGKWYWEYFALNDEFDDHNPAVLLKK